MAAGAAPTQTWALETLLAAPAARRAPLSDWLATYAAGAPEEWVVARFVVNGVVVFGLQHRRRSAALYMLPKGWRHQMLELLTEEEDDDVA